MASQRTREPLPELVGELSGAELWVIGGDFNLTPEECRAAVAGSPAITVAPGRPTCFPSLGAPSVLDFFVVSPGVERLLCGCAVLD